MSGGNSFLVSSDGARQYSLDARMYRHSDAQPGYWTATPRLHTNEAAEFFDLLPLHAHGVKAVIDDFGNLVRVQ
jgi:hypothetical protein